jgi:hypothetical protein
MQLLKKISHILIFFAIPFYVVGGFGIAFLLLFLFAMGASNSSLSATIIFLLGGLCVAILYLIIPLFAIWLLYKEKYIFSILLALTVCLQGLFFSQYALGFFGY